MWQCKGCSATVASRSELLKHYKLKHPHFGRTSRYPCTYSKCPCTFKTWNALIVHQSRVHSTPHKELSIFSCHLCACKNLTNETEFFLHINTHLKRNENVCCMFVGCDYQSSVYGTFKCHKSRHHTPHTLNDFKPGIVKTTTVAPPSDDLFADSQDEQCVEEEASDTSLDGINQHKELPSVIEQQLAAALLKLEYLVHVPGTAIDDFLQELYLINSASVPLSRGFVSDILQHHNLQVDDSVVTEITTAVCSSNPVQKAIEKALLALRINVNNITRKNSVLWNQLLTYLIIKRNTPFSMSLC